MMVIKVDVNDYDDDLNDDNSVYNDNDEKMMLVAVMMLIKVDVNDYDDDLNDDNAFIMIMMRR